MEIPISQFIEMFGDPVENPKDFDKCPLMSLAKKITDGVHKKPVYTKTGKPFISVTNINRGVIDFTDCKFVSEEAYQTMIKTTYPERGDVLYTKVGATYGIPAYVDTDEQFGLYVSVCLIKPKHDLIDARFLTESMRMEYIKKQADDRIKGIGVPDLHLQEIKSFEVLCPPRELQEQFVAFVQQSDKSKFACLKSQFIEMFGLPENNAHRFDVGVIGDVVKDVHYGTAKKAIDKGKYIYLRMNNITYDGELDLSDIKRIDVPDKDLPGCMVQRGDVLFNRTNSKDLVGKTCCFSDDEPMIIAGYIIRLRMNGKVLPEYLSVFMNLERSKKMLYSMAKGAVGQANINAKEVQSIEIVIPPMDIQNSFLTLSRQSDKSKLCFHLHTTTLHYAHS